MKDEKKSSLESRALVEIIGCIVHSVNNPLTIAQGHAELAGRMLAEGKPKETIANSLERIGNATDRIEHVIQSLHRYVTQIYSDPPSIVDAEQVLTPIKDIFRQQCESQGVDFQTDIKQPSTKLKCIPEQLRHAVSTLIQNALDALIDTQDASLRLTARIDESHYCIFVSDNGCGTTQDLDQLILPFYTSKSQQARLGLGLTIAADIIDRFSGELSLESIDDRTSFQIRLPIQD